MAKGFDKVIKNLNDLEKSLRLISKVKSAKVTIAFNFSVDILDTVQQLKKAIDIMEKKSKNLEEAHHLAMEVVALKLKKALDAAMDAEVWQWIDDTRDIIDTGALKNSGRVTYNRSSRSLSILYAEEYAGIVHYGGYIKSGYNADVQIYYPARPWIESTIRGENGIQKFPIGEIYLTEFKKHI